MTLEVEIVISYDPRTKRVGFRYTPPDLFTERRDFLYAMLERTREEILIQQLGAPKHEEIREESTGTFGKGKKTHVDRV